MALSTEGTESVCGEYAFPPLLFTHSFIYSAIYHSTDIHIIYLVFVIFYLLFAFMCILQLHPCTNCLCTIQSHNLYSENLFIINQSL